MKSINRYLDASRRRGRGWRALRAMALPCLLMAELCWAQADMPVLSSGTGMSVNSGLSERSEYGDGVRASNHSTEWGDAALVQELLRLDAQAALASERERVARLPAAVRPMSDGDGQTSRSASGMRSSNATDFAGSQADSWNDMEEGPIRLHAIYGTGARLQAELSLGGQRYLYRAGRRLPVGMLMAGQVPELERMTVACVALRMNGRSEQYCVDRPTRYGGGEP